MATLDPIAKGAARKFQKLYINEYGREILSNTTPRKSKTWWAEIYVEDIMVIFQHPLSPKGIINPEDWKKIQKDFNSELQILCLELLRP